MTAEPFTPDELAGLRRHFAAADQVGGATARRLLATLDAERDRHLGVLFDLRNAGALAVDRPAFDRWMVERQHSDAGRLAFAVFGSLTATETETYLRTHPAFAERARVTARRLAAEHGLAASAGDVTVDDVRALIDADPADRDKGEGLRARIADVLNVPAEIVEWATRPQPEGDEQ